MRTGLLTLLCRSFLLLIMAYSARLYAFAESPGVMIVHLASDLKTVEFGNWYVADPTRGVILRYELTAAQFDPDGVPTVDLNTLKPKVVDGANFNQRASQIFAVETSEPIKQKMEGLRMALQDGRFHISAVAAFGPLSRTVDYGRTHSEFTWEAVVAFERAFSRAKSEVLRSIERPTTGGLKGTASTNGVPTYPQPGEPVQPRGEQFPIAGQFLKKIYFCYFRLRAKTVAAAESRIRSGHVLGNTYRLDYKGSNRLRAANQIAVIISPRDVPRNRLDYTERDANHFRSTLDLAMEAACNECTASFPKVPVPPDDAELNYYVFDKDSVRCDCPVCIEAEAVTDGDGGVEARFPKWAPFAPDQVAIPAGCERGDYR